MRKPGSIRWDFMVALADTIVDSKSPIRLGMTEDRVRHAGSIHELTHTHGITPNMVEALCYALDDPTEVLALVEQGIPTDYILLMGGDRP